VDNVPYFKAHHLTGRGQTTQLIIARLTPRNHQGAADLQKGGAQLGHDRQCAECPCGGHIELFPANPAPVILKARVHHSQVLDPQPRGCRGDPVQPASLRVYKGE
jgi:hypothetical protein